MKKWIIWILVLVVVLAGVYMVLPEYPKAVVTSVFQPIVNSQAKTRIDQVKNLNNGKVNANYQTILEGKTNTHAWVYESEGSVEKVSFYGKGAKITIKDVKDHQDFLYTSSPVKFEFIITGNNVDISAYIEGQLQDDVIKDLMIEQLYLGSST